MSHKHQTMMELILCAAMGALISSFWLPDSSTLLGVFAGAILGLCFAWGVLRNQGS